MPTDLHDLVSSMLMHCPKTTDRSVDDVINRLIGKAMRRRRRPRVERPGRVNLGDCRIALEKWDMARLGALERHHDGRDPKREDLPVIVIQLSNEELLLDGMTRINKWVSEKRSEPHEVLVIEV